MKPVELNAKIRYSRRREGDKLKNITVCIILLYNHVGGIAKRLCSDRCPLANAVLEVNVEVFVFFKKSRARTESNKRVGYGVKRAP